MQKQRGETKFYQRAHGSENAKDDPFAIQLEDNPHLKAHVFGCGKR